GVDHGYVVQYYSPKQVSNWTSENGEWTPGASEIPFVSYKVESPDAPSSYSPIEITKFIDGNIDLVYEYSYAATLNSFGFYDTTWRLATVDNGTTIRREMLDRTQSDPNEWESTRIVRYPQDGGTWSVVNEVHEQRWWGRALIPDYSPTCCA
ncbi:MAG: hypothetical protein KKB50_04550, partial [Planctomycetes bacterium]|nr:hypothetical protein [Planctomycetota bacterium]